MHDQCRPESPVLIDVGDKWSGVSLTGRGPVPEGIYSFESDEVVIVEMY